MTLLKVSDGVAPDAPCPICKLPGPLIVLLWNLSEPPKLSEISRVLPTAMFTVPCATSRFCRVKPPCTFSMAPALWSNFVAQVPPPWALMAPLLLKDPLRVGSLTIDKAALELSFRTAPARLLKLATDVPSYNRIVLLLPSVTVPELVQALPPNTLTVNPFVPPSNSTLSPLLTSTLPPTLPVSAFKFSARALLAEEFLIVPWRWMSWWAFSVRLVLPTPVLNWITAFESTSMLPVPALPVLLVESDTLVELFSAWFKVKSEILEFAALLGGENGVPGEMLASEAALSLWMISTSFGSSSQVPAVPGAPDASTRAPSTSRNCCPEVSTKPPAPPAAPPLAEMIPCMRVASSAHTTTLPPAPRSIASAVMRTSDPT